MNISEPDKKIVDEVKSKLLEHFDSVRIFVTRHDGNAEETEAYTVGGGNFYAQLGQAHEWISIQDQYQRSHADRNSGDE